jgi:hypothetical protein
MKIAYGPPGAVGVKSLQYVGNVGDDADYTSSGIMNLAAPVAVLAAGVAAYAWSTKNKKLRTRAGAVAIGAAVVSLLKS